MSLKLAHSSKGVYLFPISHSNKFHNLLYYNINLHDSVQLGSHCEQIGSHCASLGYEIGCRHCDWLVCHCAGLVSQRIMESAHIVAEYTICTIDDIATAVGSVAFAKSMCNALITASIYAASWLLVAMFDSPSSSLSKAQARCMATYTPSTMSNKTYQNHLHWYDECIRCIGILWVIIINPWHIIGWKIQSNCQD